MTPLEIMRRNLERVTEPELRARLEAAIERMTVVEVERTTVHEITLGLGDDVEIVEHRTIKRSTPRREPTSEATPPAVRPQRNISGRRRRRPADGD